MRRIWFVAGVLCLICVVGCSGELSIETTTNSLVQDTTINTTEEVHTSTNNTTATIEQESQETKEEIPLEKRGQAQALFKNGREDAERLGVSKVLVWVTTGYTDSMICKTPEIINQFNELLVKKYGCDFVVEFQVYSSFEMELVEDANGDTHWAQRTYMHDDIVIDMMKLGHQADIIFSGTYGEFERLRAEGVYISITDYLEAEEGKKFYEAYSDAIWKRLMRSGEIYGYFCAKEPGSWYALTCNRNMAESFGIEIDEGYSFYDLGEFLSNIELPESEKTTEKIFPIYVATGSSLNSLIRMEGYYSIDQSASKDNAIYYTIDESTDKWQAVNAAEESELIKLWKTIKEYKDKGWIYFNNNTISSLVKKGNFLFLISRGNGAALVGNELIYGREFDVTVGDKWYETIYEIKSGITGIASWSEYEDEAFKLMALVNTEEELSRLLAYGIEGKNYIYEDGVLTGIESDGSVYLGNYSAKRNNLGNPNLLQSTGLEPDNKLEFYKEIGANFKESPSMIYDIDMSAYGEQLSNISKIYNEYLDKLNNGNCDDVDATVAEMNARLKEAGITEIVNDVNRQLEEAQR